MTGDRHDATGVPDPADGDPVRADGVLRDDPRTRGRAAYLPTPTVQCHAANLAWLPGGDLACVWFGGTQEGVADITAYLSRLPAGSDTWLDPVPLSDDATRSEQNPILFSAGPDELWLLYTAQVAGNQDTAEVRRRVSRDGGATWGPTTVLLPATDRGGVFVRQPPVRLRSGRLLLPVFNCVTVPGQKWAGHSDDSSVWISDDGAASWREVRVPDSLGCVHMNIVVRQDGSLWACYRSRWADHVHETTSTDDGETWAAPTPMPIPNNNSSIQAVARGAGRLAMVANWSSRLDATERRVSLYDEIDDEGVKDVDGPQRLETDPEADETAGARRAFWGAPRAPMTLLLSDDDGRNWPVRWDLAVGDGYCMSNNSRDGVNRELSYPSVLPGPDGDLHVAYTHHRQAIRHLHLPAHVIARHRAGGRAEG